MLRRKKAQIVFGFACVFFSAMSMVDRFRAFLAGMPIYRRVGLLVTAALVLAALGGISPLGDDTGEVDPS